MENILGTGPPSVSLYLSVRKLFDIFTGYEIHQI